MKVYLYDCYDDEDMSRELEYTSDSYISERSTFLCKEGVDIEIPIKFIQYPCCSFFSFKKLNKKQIDCLSRELNNWLNMPEL